MAAPAGNWQNILLNRIGAPVTPQTLKDLNAWQRSEGGSASNNPFNTTEPGFNNTGSYNSIGVKNYPTPKAGLNATVATLTNGRYGTILQSLRKGGDSGAFASAVGSSPWGTSGALLSKVLGSPDVAPTTPAVQHSTTSVNTQQPLSGTNKSATGQNINQLRQGVLSKWLLKSGQSFINGGFGGDVGSLTKSLAAVQPPKLVPVRTTQSLGSISPNTGKPLTLQTNGHDTNAHAAGAVSLAKEYLGTPYVWGGEDPSKGFDCSGLLQYVWAKQGVKIPRTTYDQFTSGTQVQKNQLQSGDAVFFTGSDPKNGLPGHVGMYIGDGKIIEAPHTGADVEISSLDSHPDYVGARRYA